MRIWPGKPYPLGATYDGFGTNFSMFSEVAQQVELCLFDAGDKETRVELPEVSGFVWHGYIPEARPGQKYGYRVHGPWDPQRGLLCNPNKLLMDPYCKSFAGEIHWDEAVFPYWWREPESGAMNDRDSAPFMPRSVVSLAYFDWTDDTRPGTPLHESVIYEVHVKGFSMKMPEIPEEIRGTYAALGHEAALDYFKALGVTALELMPIHQFVHEKHLIDRKLRNYWGYHTLGYFAPHNEYAAAVDHPGMELAEFKQVVKTLHRAGIEVILDVVYNHTAEGNHLGPMLSFKGIDNQAYYRLVPGDPRYYFDYTGTGNSLNMRHPHVLQLIMDSLRYWVTEMHVDGFRFDLASTLAREFHDVERLSVFFDLIQQDPVVSQVKLIAEPWDVGQGGYQVGNFPPLWSEWNGKYRDSIRDFWRCQHSSPADLAYRFTGSSDLYENTGRRPYASVNFVTAHDGFTLSDLVSYNDKHNEANREDSRDGESHNRSWNCGAEGETGDPAVLALRRQQQRNFLATLFLSQGIPMLLGGDEFGRTQRGNNNAYCQDNEISWYDWGQQDEDLLNFTQTLIAFRAAHPVFRRRRWFVGRSVRGSEVHDIAWLTASGSEMTEEHWRDGREQTLGVYLNGEAIPDPGPQGQRIVDDTFYLMFNSCHEPATFLLPNGTYAKEWEVVLSTGRGWMPDGEEEVYFAGATMEVAPRTLTVLRRRS